MTPPGPGSGTTPPREGRGVRRQVRRGLQLQGGADQTHRQEDEVAVQKPVGQSRGCIQTEMLDKIDCDRSLT